MKRPTVERALIRARKTFEPSVQGVVKCGPVEGTFPEIAVKAPAIREQKPLLRRLCCLPGMQGYHNPAYHEHNFHALVVWATKPRVGGGRAKKSVLGNISIWTANWRLSTISLNKKQIADMFEKFNHKAQSKKLSGGCHTCPHTTLISIRGWSTCMFVVILKKILRPLFVFYVSFLWSSINKFTRIVFE